MNLMGIAGRNERFRPTLWAGLSTIVVLPLIAMQFTGEVNWNAADFLAAAMLLAVLGAAVELIIYFVADVPTRVVLIAAAVACVLLVWADAAVGIFE